jgi:nucleolar complex protein 2
MGKQTKRTRKFISSGGVKGRLQKGTITSKGSLKRKNKKNGGSRAQDKAAAKRARTDNAAAQYMSEREQKREEAEFTSKKNLGDLDMESFFETFGEDESDVDVEDEITEDSMNDSDENDKEMSKSQGSAGDSDSEDEDIEEAERRMKEEMAKLQNKDPEFHQFLRENEDSLLEYGDDDIQSDDDDENDDYDDDFTQQSKRKEKNASEDTGDSSIRLTKELLAKYEKGAFKSHGVKALKKLVNAYRSACHMTDEEKLGDARGGPNHTIDSSDVFDRLMVVVLMKCKDELHYHLLGQGSKKEGNGEGKNDAGKKKSKNEDNDGDSSESEEEDDENSFDPDKPINPKILKRCDRWNDFNKILYTFFKATAHILSEAKESQLVVFVLKALFEYIPYMTPFPRLAETMLKILTSLWSAPIDSSEDYQVVRLHAFLRIRQLAMTQPFPFIEECLKKLYLAYAQRAKFATASSVTSALPTLTFMGNCVVELYSLDYHSSYQHAFIYIRQLALHLRTAMQKKTPEAMGAVYCWQYLHCLKLWVAVLTEACQSEDDLEGLSTSEDQLLRSLIFPLTQVILGTARLIPSTRYLPLRLHCVRLLQQLAAAAEIFLPTTSILLDVFELQELSQPPKKVHKSSVQPMALTLRLRADNPLRSMEEMEMCLSEVFVLLNREVDLYRYSAGFPEFSVRICQRLRKVSRWSCCMKLRQQIDKHNLTRSTLTRLLN